MAGFGKQSILTFLTDHADAFSPRQVSLSVGGLLLHTVVSDQAKERQACKESCATLSPNK